MACPKCGKLRQDKSAKNYDASAECVCDALRFELKFFPKCSGYLGYVCFVDGELTLDGFPCKRKNGCKNFTKGVCGE